MLGGFLLAFAGWPLLAAGLLVLVMGLLVAGLLITVFFQKFSRARRPRDRVKRLRRTRPGGFKG